MKTYQESVAALLKNDDDIHLVAGLAAECGEVCGLFQKASYKSIPIDLEDLTEELGDILFYVAAIADKHLNFDLEYLQRKNVEKLKRRHDLKIIHRHVEEALKETDSGC